MSKNIFLNRPEGFLHRSKNLYKIDHKTSIIIRICKIIIIQYKYASLLSLVNFFHSLQLSLFGQKGFLKSLSLTCLLKTQAKFGRMWATLKALTSRLAYFYLYKLEMKQSNMHLGAVVEAMQQLQIQMQIFGQILEFIFWVAVLVRQGWRRW